MVMLSKVKIPKMLILALDVADHLLVKFFATFF